ncbi:MAG: general secretion pathway protein GspK [Gammaproteobacteria bacterium]
MNKASVTPVRSAPCTLPGPGPNASRGVALIAVLWIVALLTVIGAGFALDMRTETTLTQELLAGARARAAAEAGVFRGIWELLKPDRRRRWRADGTERRWSFRSYRVIIALQNEGGRIDLNSAGAELLGALLEANGVEDERRATLVDAIQDWRDPDDARGANGAEDPEYQAEGRAAGPKNGPFNTVAELQQVLGMSRRLYERIAPALTVHSRQPKVDAQLAPPSVLRAVLTGGSGSEDALEEFLADKEQEADEPGGTGEPRRLAIPGLNPRFLSTSNGEIYTIQAMATVRRSNVASAVAHVSATIRVTNQPRRPYTVLAWREGRELF